MLNCFLIDPLHSPEDGFPAVGRHCLLRPHRARRGLTSPGGGGEERGPGEGLWPCPSPSGLRTAGPRRRLRSYASRRRRSRIRGGRRARPRVLPHPEAQERGRGGRCPRLPARRLPPSPPSLSAVCVQTLMIFRSAFPGGGMRGGGGGGSKNQPNLSAGRSPHSRFTRLLFCGSCRCESGADFSAGRAAAGFGEPQTSPARPGLQLPRRCPPCVSVPRGGRRGCGLEAAQVRVPAPSRVGTGAGGVRGVPAASGGGRGYPAPPSLGPIPGGGRPDREADRGEARADPGRGAAAAPGRSPRGGGRREPPPPPARPRPFRSGREPMGGRGAPPA